MRQTLADMQNDAYYEITKFMHVTYDGLDAIAKMCDFMDYETYGTMYAMENEWQIPDSITCEDRRMDLFLDLDMQGREEYIENIPYSVKVKSNEIKGELA